MPAISTVKKAREDAFLLVLVLWRSALSLFYKLLHLLPRVAVNDRLVNVLEDCPIFFWVLNSCFVSERLLRALEVDDITAVFLLCEHLGNGCLAPLIRIGLCLLTTSTHTLTLPIGLWYKNFIILENSCNSLVSVSFDTKSKYPLHNLCRIGINDPLLGIIGRFDIHG